MRHVTLVAACLVAMCCGAAAETAPRGKETLVVPTYPDKLPWKKITNVDNAEQIYFEWIPEDQSESDIKDILVEQVFYKMKGYPPGNFIKGLFVNLSRACQSLRVNGPVEHIENGYPIAYAQEYCSNQKGADKDVDIFLKVISGKDALYIVQREFRRPTEHSVAGVRTFEEGKLQEVMSALRAQKLANIWLTTVQLCPPGSETCPTEPMPSSAAVGPQAAPAP